MVAICYRDQRMNELQTVVKYVKAQDIPMQFVVALPLIRVSTGTQKTPDADQILSLSDATLNNRSSLISIFFSQLILLVIFVRWLILLLVVISLALLSLLALIL